MLGIESNVRPRFVRQYAQLAEETRSAVQNYIEDVRSGRFPSKEESY
jgi:3-methyl-2-oxobutanoate hydroxymethyltransferase